MAQLANTLLPLVLLMGVGYALAHIRFLGRDFLGDLNKLVFWIALPCLIFRSLARAELSAHETWRVLLTVTAATLITLTASWLLARAFRTAAGSIGTLQQSAFRGNLAYIGLPTITYSLEALPKEIIQETLSTALVALAATTALFNVLAVFCLLPRAHASAAEGGKLILRSIATNPIIIACVAGLLFACFRVRLPDFLDRTLESLGAAAVPIALLCIGGSFVVVSIKGKTQPVMLAAAGKLLIAPAAALLIGLSLGLAGLDLRVALIYSTCPTAAAAYIMAKQMGGDEALASASIAVTTVLCFIPLAAILLFT